MGEILGAYCKYCNYQEKNLYSGGFRRGGGSHYLTIEKTSNSVVSFFKEMKKKHTNEEMNSLIKNITKKNADKIVLSLLNEDFDQQERPQLYFYDKTLSKKKFRLQLLLEKFTSKNFGNHSNQKHRCPRCLRFTLEFKAEGLWD